MKFSYKKNWEKNAINAQKVWNHKESNALILQLVAIVVEFDVQFHIQFLYCKTAY